MPKMHKYADAADEVDKKQRVAVVVVAVNCRNHVQQVHISTVLKVCSLRQGLILKEREKPNRRVTRCVVPLFVN